jgi:hypothetical protein
MKNKQHGWLVAVIIEGYTVYQEFFKTELEAFKEREMAYRYNPGVEYVTIDEVFYDPESGEYVAA